MQLRRWLGFCLILLLHPVALYAQTSTIDSLLAELDHSNADTQRVNLLLEVSQEYYNLDPEKAISYGKEGLELSLLLRDTIKAGYCLKSIGIGHYIRGEYVLALEFWDEAKTLFLQASHLLGVSNMLNNMGAVYYDRGNDPKALELYLESLRYAEQLRDSVRIATAWTNIGGVHEHKELTMDKAIEAFRRAIRIAERTGYDQALGAGSANLGGIYEMREQYDSAIYYHKIALEATKGTYQSIYSRSSLGFIYTGLGDLDTAELYFKQAMDEARLLDYKLGVSDAYVGLATVNESRGQLGLAVESFKNAIDIATKLSEINPNLRKAYSGLARVYSKQGNFEEAFATLEKLSLIKDSIYSVEVDQKLGQQMFDFELEKKEGEIAILNKDRLIQEANIRRQKTLRNGFIAGFSFMVFFAGVFFVQRNKIFKEKKRSDELLLNILPASVAAELKTNGYAEAKDYDLVTVIFTDFKGFTDISAKLDASALVAEINTCFSAFDKIIESAGLEKIKTIGDAYMAAGGLHVPKTSEPRDVVLAALEMQAFIQTRSQQLATSDQPFFEMRVGIHTGPVVAGIVGVKKFQYDIWGDTVNTASRMESSGEVGKVNISQSTYELIKDDPDFVFEQRGRIEVKGKGELEMWFVRNATDSSSKLEVDAY